MHKTFIKDSEIRSFRVENNKVYTTIELDGFKVTNPTLEQFLSLGWEEYIPEPIIYTLTLEELVEQKIRERYSINQEFEVNRKRDTEPENFQIYYDYVEQCIEQAKNQLSDAVTEAEE